MASLVATTSGAVKANIPSLKHKLRRSSRRHQSLQIISASADPDVTSPSSSPQSPQQQQQQDKPIPRTYKKDTETFADVMGFSGTIPERVNGRLAMIAFAAGVGAEFSSNTSIIQQASSAPTLITLAALSIALGSIMPKFVTGVALSDMYKAAETGDKLGGGFFGVFTSPLELWTGRVAMLGFVGLIAVEQFVNAGAPLF